MKRKNKAIFGLTLAMMLILSTTINVLASDLKGATEIGIGIDRTEDDISTRYFSTCPYADKHSMQGRGTGLVYYGSAGSTDLRIRGTASQCKYCNLVLITENNPFSYSTKNWGNYATMGAEEPLGTNIIMYTKSISYSSSINNDYELGFTFR